MHPNEPNGPLNGRIYKTQRVNAWRQIPMRGTNLKYKKTD